MSKIISLTNQKGGVGKTTSSVNLAVSFAVSEVKTLLIDLDPQSNATTGIEDLIVEPKGSIYDAIIRGSSTKDVITKTKLDFLDIIGNIALNTNNTSLNLNDFLKFEENGKSISDLLTEMIAKIGENLIINDLKVFDNKEAKLNYYIHNPYRKNIGKIVSAVFYSSNEENEDVKNFSKNLCMHIAASKPESMDIDNLPLELVESEKKIQEEMIKDSGKPSNVILIGDIKQKNNIKQDYIKEQ